MASEPRSEQKLVEESEKIRGRVKRTIDRLLRSDLSVSLREILEAADVAGASFYLSQFRETDGTVAAGIAIVSGSDAMRRLWPLVEAIGATENEIRSQLQKWLKKDE